MNPEIKRKKIILLYDEGENRNRFLRTVNTLFPEVDFEAYADVAMLRQSMRYDPSDGIIMADSIDTHQTDSLVKMIKSTDQRSVPILILSEFDLPQQDKTLFLRAGADDFLQGDDDDETVKARLTMILKLSSAVNELGYLASHLEDQIKERMYELKQRDEQFRLFADNINEVFWMSTPYGNEIIYVSPAYEKIWGRTCQSLYEQPKTLLDAIVPEDREHIRTKLGGMLYGSFDEEYRIIRPDGEIRWIRGRAFPVRDQFGKLYRIVGIADDISKRKEAEAELIEERHRITSFLNISGSLIIGINRDMTVSLANKKACELLEYSESEIIGRNWFETFIPEEEREVVKQVFGKLMSGEIDPVEQFNNRIMSKNGDITIIRWRNTYLHDNKGAIYATMSSGEIIGPSLTSDGESQAG